METFLTLRSVFAQMSDVVVTFPVMCLKLILRIWQDAVDVGGKVEHPLAVHAQVLELDVLDLDSWRSFRVFGADAYSGARTPEDDVADGAVTHDAVADADAEGVAARPQDAVRDCDMLAGARLKKRRHLAAQGDAVVSRVDIAVGDGDPLAAVDVYAVAGWRWLLVEDSEVGDGGVLAAVKEACPIARVEHLDSRERDALALAEEDHLRGAPFGKFEVGRYIGP